MKFLLCLMFCVGVIASGAEKRFVVVGLSGETAKEYMDMPKRQREDLCQGFMWAVLASPIWGGKEEEVGEFRAAIQKATAGQLDAIVIKHLKENPKLWNQPANVQIWSAWKDAFLKKPAKPK